MIAITRRSLLSMSAATTAAFALPRLASAQSGERPAVTVAVQRISNSNTLEMLTEQSNVGARIYTSYAETLLGNDWIGDMSLQPQLATSWKRLDDLTVEVDLREGVKFHNGDVMTAEDVAFSYGPDRMWGGATVEVPDNVKAVARQALPAFERIEVLGAHKIRLHNASIDPVLEGRLSASIGMIVNKRAFLEAKSWMDWARLPVTTGPYSVAEYKPDSVLTLAAFDDHWEGRPPLRQIRFVETPETASRINLLRSGGADFACDIPPDQIATVEADKRFKVVGGPINNTRYTVFNKSHPVLANPLVRQALTHAVDRNLIVETLWSGRTEVPRGLQWEFYGDFYIADHENPAYDPDKARALLRKAGYNGEPIPYRVLNDYYTAQTATAQINTENWRSVGLNIKMQMVENWGQIQEGGPETRGIHDWSAAASLPDPYVQMSGSWGPLGTPWKTNQWRNEEFGGLSNELGTSTDRTRRIAVWRRMLQIIEIEDPAYVVLHRNASFTAKRADIQWAPAKSFVMDFRRHNWSA
jgi:peptide/nickel transport system substrate-binding protein